MLTDGRCPEGGRPEAAGWVLCALDPGETLSFGEHLLTCEICRGAVDELRMTARLLQGTLFKSRPPASLCARTLDRIHREAGYRGW
jgi:hypothetical protein